MFSLLCLLVLSEFCNHVSGIAIQSSNVMPRLDSLRQKDQNLLKKLKDYELIRPKETTPVDRNELFPEIYQREEKVERSISFPYKGEKIILDLVPNKSLLSPRYKARFFLPDGRPVMKKRTVDSFFHGHIRGQEGKSDLAMRTDNGYQGYFKHNDNVYFIQPLFSKENKRIVHIIYKSNDMESEPAKCGHDDSRIDDINSFASTHHQRVRRNVLTETKFVELIIVNDVSQYKKQGSNLEETEMRAIEIVNVADSIYRRQKIRMVIVLVETWTTKNKIDVENNPKTTIANFFEYKKNVLDKNDATKHHDNAQFLSQIKYTNNVVGRGYVKTMCTYKSVGIVTDKNDANAATTGEIMAHEIGHNFGLEHNAGECVCDGCTMNDAVSGQRAYRFSQCSITSLEKLLLEENVGTCLFNKPTKLVNDPVCGNGFLETGEECDCGNKEECLRAGNSCCNYLTCMLYEGNQCSDGECCEKCQYRTEGELCRDVVNSCDLPEYCTGTSGSCPSDVSVLNGLSCDNDKAYCYDGQCRTHTAQCKSLWKGGNVRMSADVCYNTNKNGNKYAYCKKTGEDTYEPCKPADVQCGKLQCDGTNLTPLSTGWSFISTSTITSYPGGTRTVDICKRMTRIESGDDLGMVEDGIKCGNGKICMDNECKALSVVFSGQGSCTNDGTCNGNGVCNQYGNCHCNSGWKCPFCAESYSGPGRSVNSGGESCVKEVNECSNPSICHAHATCTNTKESYTCKCNKGYIGDGKSCKDINECTYSSVCHANAVCKNTAGSYKCACKEGYTGDGKTCTVEELNECLNPSICDAHATCTNTKESYTCTCNKGYAGNGKSCKDINECIGGGNTCHTNAVCINIAGSYRCACKNGYIGNGKTICTDVNECSNPSLCDAKATCTNTIGSYTCKCNKGYTGDGKSCKEIGKSKRDCKFPECFCIQRGYICARPLTWNCSKSRRCTNSYKFPCCLDFGSIWNLRFRF